jgi:LDH2 family malate/lactate/ureidoglycolate dehydrogenase
MVAGLHNTKTLPGVDAVHIPGERAAQERHHRQLHGIPLTSVVRDQFTALLLDLGLGNKYEELFKG